MATANKAFDVFRNGKFVTRVFYEQNFSEEEVKESLTKHDGLPVDIVVKHVRHADLLREQL